MKNERYLKLVNDSGALEIYEILYVFALPETGKEYIVYSDNEVLEDGKKNMYASIYNSETSEISPIEDDNEWEKVSNMIESLSDDE